MALDLDKKAEVAITVGSHRTCSDGRGRENKCGDGETPTTRGRVSHQEPIHHGYG